MKKKLIVLVIVISLISAKLLNAQWLTTVHLDDMNTWNPNAGFIEWYNHTNNTPNGQVYGNGIQLLLAHDPRFGAQVVIPTFEQNIYFRRYTPGSWDNWVKVWHSGNFDPSNFLGKTSSSIANSGAVNSFTNGYTFAYSSSGSPWNGAFLSFGGFSNDYDCQLSTDYGPFGGNHISFRTKNGDIGSWNNWNEFYHSGNLINPISSKHECINTPNAADDLHNEATFSYVGGTPYYGAFLSFGGLNGNYDCQINTHYMTGNNIAWRQKNGDNDTWSSWKEFYHAGNLNSKDIDFNCRNLSVNGTVHSKEVKVDLTGWSDFVFYPAYKLKPLTEVEHYIKTNGHLENIPSAEQVEQNGVNVGDMQAKLLQKVEELTLYSIEQEKKLAEQDKAKVELKEKLEEQDKKLAEQAKQNAELKQEVETLKQLIIQKLK